jgi:two-component system CheB/CheR fusion protein
VAKKKSTRRASPSAGRPAPAGPIPQPAPLEKSGAKRPKRAATTASVAGAAHGTISAIVGIGGSAGGLAPLRELLAALPDDSRMAFIVITHQAPDGRSLLPEILAKSTQLPVQEVRHETRVEADHVYVVGRGHHVSIRGGMLLLEEPLERGIPPLPIDHFLRSLARDQEQRSVGIILSGTGTDGTLGLAAIKGSGGLALVQEPRTAEFDGMPTSAIAAHATDAVLSVADLAERLTQFARDRAESPRARAEAESPGEIDRILAAIRARGGPDFSAYKSGTLMRRVERRMELHRIARLAEYTPYLEEHPAEIDALWRDWLIGVSGFFRDPEAFHALEHKGLTELLASREAGSPFRIWVPGCATGEEAYSIGMLVLEALHGMDKRLDVQVFATDLDPSAIHTARQGRFPEGIAADVGAERIERFFVREDRAFRARRELRDLVVFAVQNVLVDPPFTHVDLLSCRNLLIYIVASAQEELLRVFHYSLNPGGLLLLGPSESISGLEGYFTPLDRRWKLFRRNDAAPSPSVPRWASRQLSAHQAAMKSQPSGAAKVDLADLQRRALAERFGPPAVIVDSRGQIQQVHGSIGPYLELPPGRANLNVLEMAREGLRATISSGLRDLQKGDAPSLSRSSRVRSNGDWVEVQVTVARIDGAQHPFPLFLVTFEPLPQTPQTAKRGRERSKGEPGDGNRLHLEQELQHTRQDLQSSINELQSANEELASANEEVQSANEELQSSNEELQTSKEETQSLNEELHTVNAELTQKLQALEQANDDLLNLMNNVEIATIFLDDQLRVQRFTPQARIVANLLETDAGRPLADLATRLDYPGLLSDAAGVLKTLKPVETRAVAPDGAWYTVRIRPYRTMRNAVEGLVINFIDITQTVRANRLEAAHELAESIVDTVREPLIVLDSELRVLRANRAFYATFQVQPEQTRGELIYDLGEGQWNIPELRDRLERMLDLEPGFDDFSVEREFPRIGHKRMLLNARRVLIKGAERPALIVLGIDDVTGPSLTGSRAPGESPT